MAVGIAVVTIALVVAVDFKNQTHIYIDSSS